MKISKHIGFSKSADKELWKYLTENNVVCSHTEGEDIASLDIYTSDPHWPWIYEYVKKEKLVCLSDTIFSKDELQRAEWMRVRSIWRFGYPEPSGGYEYKNITYTRAKCCENCGAGLEQIDSFRIKRVPSWGRRHFFSLYWIEDELFVSDSAKSALLDANISGVSFLPVKSKNGEYIFPGIQQLRISNILKDGFLAKEEYIKKINLCLECKKVKYCTNGGGKLAFRKEIFEDAPDIVKTGEIFGGMPKLAAREIIINHKVYKTIVDNHLERGLMFYPIDLI